MHIPIQREIDRTCNIQAFVPVAILLISWTFRIHEPNKRLAVIVFMISAGVALARTALLLT